MIKIQFIITILVLLFFTNTAAGQDNNPLRIYHHEGNIQIIRKGKSIECSDGSTINAGDKLTIDKGTITLISRDCKRITLNEKKTYSYSQIIELFKKVEASQQSKFIDYVWGQMTKKDMTADVPGAVVRNKNKYAVIPIDSTIIIQDTLVFLFENQDKLPMNFRLYDNSGSLIFEMITHEDTVLLIPDSCFWWQPGTFSWRVGLDKSNYDESTFIVPDENWKQNLKKEHMEIQDFFSFLPTEEWHRVERIWYSKKGVYQY